ncbi:hypothetical protein DFQ28_001638 [Apophysomyces sp. BC1034]|nr:hypothetical protein DFQ30_001947 [Apophysomyces sp. BC1015]KAG0180192.1 hypothetical protein DFQ29_001058 [Apophysomyces sp. BC1021]KAG0190750.1 hypothetical protein DFQ28_001638 [Apophysomyces sp. BC1034]
MADQQQEAQIKTLLEEGNRAFSLDDYDTSVIKFGEACQLLDTINGYLSPENGDAYFLYGRALLKVAIRQNSVLGQAAQASATAVEQAEQEQEVTNTNARLQFAGEPELEDSEDEDEEDAAGELAEEGEGAEGAVEDDFENAWDILDIARVIFEKDQDEATQLKLADVHMCLGDVSIETEKFNDALPDYRKAIEIKERLLEPDNRQLAEVYYTFALALEFSSESHNAHAEIDKAITVLNKRVEKLQAASIGKGKAKETESINDDASVKEIAEIKEMIPELELKKEELSSRKNTEAEADALLKSMLGTVATEKTSVSAQTLVNDLTTLVKRKAKDDTKVSDESNKKQKVASQDEESVQQSD